MAADQPSVNRYRKPESKKVKESNRRYREKVRQINTENAEGD